MFRLRPYLSIFIKTFILFSFLFSFTALSIPTAFSQLAVAEKTNNFPSVNYILTPHPEAEQPYLEVKMTFVGEQSGKTGILLPSSWAGASYIEQIEELRLEPENANLKMIEDKNPNQKIILHKPSENISLKYKIKPVKKKSVENLVQQNIIEKDFYQLVGIGTFILPFSLEQEPKKEQKLEQENSLLYGQKYHFKIQWNNLPKDWLTASSHGLEQELQFDGITHDLFALYCAGKVRIYPLNIYNHPVYFMLYGNFDFADDTKLQKEIATVINSQRSYFKDFQFPHYFISMIESQDLGSSGGTGYPNSFAMFFHRAHSIPHAPKNPLITFAHEHLHVWIGSKIRGKEEDEGLNYWWSEGFTDYFSRLLLYRSNLLSELEFAQEINTILENYYLSPVRNQPNKIIKEAFWTNSDVSRLPYIRGFTFALWLDGQIRFHNQGKNTLDNLLQDLFHHTQKTKENFTLDLFDRLAKKYIPKGIIQELDSYIIKGNTIELSSLFKQLPMNWTEKGRFDLGFSLKSLVDKKIIEEIDPTSNAYKAGLRNNQIVQKRDLITLDEPNQVLHFTIDNKEYIFKPESKNKTQIPQITIENQDDIQKMKKWFNPV